MQVEPRLLKRTDRVFALRRGLERRRDKLERSLAHCRTTGRAPSERQLANWAKLADQIAEFERVLGQLKRGELPPPSPKTGSRAALLPDRIDGGTDAKS